MNSDGLNRFGRKTSEVRTPIMNIAITYSSKEGLLREYRRRFGGNLREEEIPPDFFAEGDSPQTIEAVTGALESRGHRVVPIEANDRAPQRLERHRPDMVFNMAEGLFGDFRESHIPMVCEGLGIPYTGSDPLTLALCLNKARAKQILGYYLIPSPAYRVFYPGQTVDLHNFDFPAVIKPLAEGSSKGIFDDSVVEDSRTAHIKIFEKIELYHQAVIVEKFLNGSEFTVAMWGNAEELEILPIVAINYRRLPQGARAIYSYEAKWIWDCPEKPLEIFQCPAPVSLADKNKIEAVARDAYRALAIRDWCRIDIRMDENGIPHVLELNPLPGILPNSEDNSCFPKAARTAGYSYAEMINRVVHTAAKRYGVEAWIPKN